MARSGDDTEIDPAAEVMAAIADVLAGCAYLRRRAGQLSVSVLVAAAGESMRALGGPRSSPGSRHRCQLGPRELVNRILRYRRAMGRKGKDAEHRPEVIGREIICPALLAAFDFPAGHKPWSAQGPGRGQPAP
jgi:hypothetical protein